ESLKVCAIELITIEHFGAALDECIIVISLLEVQVVLPVIVIRRDELAVDGSVDFTQDSLYQGEQVVGRNATEILYCVIVETEAITQLLGCRANGSVNIARREAMDRQAMYNAQSHLLICWTSESVLDTVLQ